MALLRPSLFGLTFDCVLIIASMNLVAGRMVDMTHKINNRSSHFPLWRDFELKNVMKRFRPDLGGLWLEANEVLMNEHTGTHIDAPIHTSKGGKYVDEIPVGDLIGPAIVIDIKEQAKINRDYALTVEDIKEFEKMHGQIPDGAIVFIDTDGAKDYWNPAAYSGSDDAGTHHFPGFGNASIEFLCIERNIKGIGSDRMTFDIGNTHNYPVHGNLLGRGKIGIENANNVNKLPPVGATVFVMALPFEGGSGSPARIVAFWDTDLPVHSASDRPTPSGFLMSLFLILIIFATYQA